MKIYIAARFDKKNEVLQIQRLFKERGHKIIADWTSHEYIKPYEQNKNMANQYATEDINGAKDCDVFIILSDEAGTGMYVELGAAIASNSSKGKPRIYVVGENNSRSMFYFHPSVNRRQNIEQILGEI